MSEKRLEKKFVFEEGDFSYNYFILNAMFKKTFPERKINSIYFDTQTYGDVWDNINGFGNRNKSRIRWYNDIHDSDVFFEQKKKINFVTHKEVVKIGRFKNYFELSNYLDSEKFINSDYFNKKQKNRVKSLLVQYDRNYYELTNKKLRLTVDNNLKIYNKFPNNFLKLAHTIIEIKFNVNNSDYVNKFVYRHKLNNRNKKFSKYVNSFILLNDSGLV